MKRFLLLGLLAALCGCTTQDPAVYSHAKPSWFQNINSNPPESGYNFSTPGVGPSR